MMDLNALYWFVKVVELGSMSEAARQGGMAVSTVSAKVAQLERELQMRLLERSTRRLRLTEAGELFFERAQLAITSAEGARLAVESWSQTPSGLLTVSAVPELTRSRLRDLPRLLTERYSGLRVRLILSTERQDLLKNNIDLAIRMGQLEDSQLVARRLAGTRTFLVASREYLKRHGTPSKPADLKAHRCIVQVSLRTGGSQPVPWLFTRGREVVRHEPEGVLETSSIGSALDYARQGLGIAMTADMLEPFRYPELQEVLPQWQMPDAAVWGVYPSKAFVPPKVRAAIGIIAELMAPSPS